MNSNALLGLGSIKLDYTPSKKEKIYYNANFQSSANDVTSLLNSETFESQNTFKTLRDADNSSLKQYFEWHKSISDQQTTTFVVNQAFEKTTPINQWITNQPFLAGLLPLEEDSIYEINQIKNIKSSNVDALFKHYWIINNFNHLYSVDCYSCVHLLRIR